MTSLSIVLHAHLPWVLPARNAGPCSFEEAWLHEALWECYLPLLDVLSRRDPAAPLCVLSVSPTLLAMLRSPLLASRFSSYVESLRAELQRAKAEDAASVPAVAALEDRLNSSVQAFDRWRGDLPSVLRALADRGAVELGTTAATHAILPNLLTEAGARAQIRMGLRYFHHTFGRPARFFWLPECAYHEKLSPLLGDSGIASTVVDAHAFELAEPRPRHGVFQPVFPNEPFSIFGRHAALSNAIWSNETGYPSAKDYRDFHAPRGTDSPLARAVKLRAISKAGYEPARAARLTREHAADFLVRAHDALRSSTAARPIATVAFDAELFGHWWWEGPLFLEHLFELAERPGSLVALETPSVYLARDPQVALSRPAASTWGRGGFLEVWSHPKVSHAHRIIQRAERTMLEVDALVRDAPRTATQRRARILAIRELFLLQGSDALFMLRTGQSVPFAEARIRTLSARLDVLFRIALREREAAGDAEVLDGLEKESVGLFRELDEDAFADCFDAF